MKRIMSCYDFLTFVNTFPSGSGIGERDRYGVDSLHGAIRFLFAVGEQTRPLGRRIK